MRCKNKDSLFNYFGGIYTCLVITADNLYDNRYSKIGSKYCDLDDTVKTYKTRLSRWFH